MRHLRRFFHILRHRQPGNGVLNAPFEAGQVWAYQARPGEQASRLVVCKVEIDARLGEIVHLYVNKLNVKNPAAPDGVTQVIGHMPYSGVALRPCLTALEQLFTPPSIEDGYATWKAAFDSGNGGVWTIPLAEAISAMEAALNQRSPDASPQADRSD